MRLFHGTDLDSAKRLLDGEELSAAKAASLKIDGPAWLFLAFEVTAAEFLALRQLRGPAAVLAVDISPAALSALMQRPGVIRRPIPRSARSPRFTGDEILVSPEAFDRYAFRPPPPPEPACEHDRPIFSDKSLKLLHVPGIIPTR